MGDAQREREQEASSRQTSASANRRCLRRSAGLKTRKEKEEDQVGRALTPC